MSIFTADAADTGEIPPLRGEHHARIQVTNQPGEYGARRLPGESTINMTVQRLRQGEVYNSRRLSAADTLIVRTDLTADPEQVADARLRPGEPFLAAYAPDWRDTWINTGEIPPSTFSQMLDAGLQDPPTGNPSPIPPQPPAPKTLPMDDACGCCILAEKPLGRRGTRRAPMPLRTQAALVVGLTLAAYASGWFSHLLAVIR